ncbi:TIGR02206 family membrane protein [Bacillaceae bacterium SIJ1]|uniref:YwaF family protein n=1 Tax=Litoribacterium kuwaitense TaxID=1398745 RepID=UPI0013EC7048|nr:TIGR02206 family membrane protein [Litoribacterium kuwaitense]NGP44025.1 TIGR02206 family membrane protein [Litoribacterium kuwaitense]
MNYFSPKAVPFETLGMAHLFAWLFMLLVLFLILYMYKCLPHVLWHSRWIWVIILIVVDASLYVWYLASGVWNTATTLPFNLCSLMLYFTIWMLIRPSPKLSGIVFLLTIAGALQAMLTPELFYGYPHYRFFQFFIAHAVMICGQMHLFFSGFIRFHRFTFVYAWLFLNGLAGLAWFINEATGGNYFFVHRKPDNASLLDLLGPYPWYLLSLEIVALIILAIIQCVFVYLQKFFKCGH